MYYTKDTILFLNGKFIKAVDAHTDLYSQTLHYGFGAFEGIRAYQTMNGVKIFKAYEHFERLKKSCALVGIPFNYETEELSTNRLSAPREKYFRRRLYPPACILRTEHAVDPTIGSLPDDVRLGVGKISRRQTIENVYLVVSAP